jgi:hypothetical protein
MAADEAGAWFSDDAEDQSVFSERFVMSDEIESMEICWEVMLNRFWCNHHMRECLIVNRGPGVFITDCGCAFRMSDSYGVRWINTTAPSTVPPDNPR